MRIGAKSLAVAAAVGIAMLVLCGAARGATYVVDGNSPKTADTNSGAADAPVKTIAKGLALAKAGDTVLVKPGTYSEAVDITKSGEPNRPITLLADPNQPTVILGGIAVSGASHIRVEGFKLTWADGNGPSGKAHKDFLSVSKSSDVEIARCEAFDKTEKDDWLGVGVVISDSNGVTVRDGRLHHVNLGVALAGAKDCVVRNMDIGPWEHEDGLRTIHCDGILVENCDIHTHEPNTPEAAHKQSGHVDGIQVIYGNDNLTIRNVRVHVKGQGITGFTDNFGTKWDKPRKNIRIEGCIVEATNEVHGITFVQVEDPVIVNNTVVGTRINITSTKGGVVKNNIATSATFAGLAEEDYNLWIEGLRGKDAKPGPHDLMKVDPLFVDPARHDFRLKAGSPAIDSADSSVGRMKDRAGNEAFDDPNMENKGAGPKPYLDRGALEYVPQKK
jgi:hypothetical protein